jgi:hypothetical protein
VTTTSETAAWRLLVDEATVTVTVPRRRRDRLALAARLASLPAGTPVALVADGWGARMRCREVVQRAGIHTTGDWLAVPSARRPLYLARSTPAALAYLVTTCLAPPPRLARGHGLVDAGLRLVERLRPWRAALRWAPGLVDCGVRDR